MGPIIGGLATESLAPLIPVWLIALVLIIRRFGRRLPGPWLDMLVVSAYVPAAAIFFWLPLFVSGFFMPKGGGDLIAYYFPTYRYAGEMLRAGVFPLWNPHLYGGSPFFADVEASVLYPVNLLYHVLAPALTYAGLELLLMAHYVIAAAGAYAFARSLGLARLAAFGAGLVFAFSGFNVARFGHANILIGAVWLPLILLFLDRVLVRRRLLDAICVGALYGLVILGAHPQMPIYFALFFAFYVLVRIRSVARAQGLRLYAGFVPPASHLALVGAAVVLAGTIAAVQLLPGLELAALSVRSELSYRDSSALSLEPLGFITLLVPHFFGDSPAEHWGLRSGLVEIYAYAGVSTLVFALVGFIGRRQRRDLIVLFALIALFFGLLALGENTIFRALTHRFLPGFDKLRAAGRFLLFVDLALAMLAALGIDAMMRPLPKLLRRAFGRLLLVLGGVLLAAAVVLIPYFYNALLTSQDKDPAIFQRISTAIGSLNMSVVFLTLSLFVLAIYRYARGGTRVAAVLAILAIGFDLFSANAGFNVTRENPESAYAPNAVTQFLPARPSEYRLDASTGIEDVWQPNSALIYRLADVMGLDKALFLRDYRRYWENLGSRSIPAYDLLGAQFLLARKDVKLDWDKFTVENSDHPRLNLYRNDRALPRAMLVPAAIGARGDGALERLRAGDFDPRRVVLLNGGDDSGAQADRTSMGDVQSIEYPTPNEVLIHFRADRPGYLLLNDVMYPGWRAYVDGGESPVYRANYVFRAIKAPAGQHQVWFVFQPSLWRLGLAVSLLAAAVVMCTLVLLTVVKARSTRPG